MSNSTTKDELRRQLNLKNLQRHDPSIDRIVASTSYASIYDNKGHGWVKTGVEGPMFLFSRTTAPHYGFFVLNRNGLEYVQEFLTPESEVQVGGEFILYESGKDADRATGIWVFEEKERHELCRQMEQVRARAASSEGAKATAPGLPRGKPISVDMLFSAASPTPAAATLPAPQEQQQQQQPNAAPTQKAVNPLDALFASATMSPRPAPAAVPAAANPQTQPQTQRLPATLEQLFAAASPTPQAAQLPTRQQQQQQQQQQAQSPPPPAAGGGGGGMALLDSIFAAAAENSSPRPAAMRAPVPAPAPAAPYNHHTTPYSPPPPPRQMPPFGSQPAPVPTSPPPPPPPRDARDLLAMLGGIGSGSVSGSSGSGSVSSPRAAAAAAGAQPNSNGMMTTSTITTTTTSSSSGPEPGRSSSPVDLATEPHTTVHPQGFSMDVQTGTIAPDLVTSTSPTPTLEFDSPLFNNTNSGGGAPPPPPSTSDSKSNEKSKAAASTTTSLATTPMFAPPVLSHDIFASLPLPGGAPAAGGGGGGGGGGRAAVKEELPARRGKHVGPDSSAAPAPAPAPAPAAVPRPDSRIQTRAEPDSSVPAPAKEEEAPRPTGALSSPSSSSSMPTTEPQRRQAPAPSSSPSSLLIDKAELVSRVDNILTESGVGMTAQANGNSRSDGPMSKEEFVVEALKVIQVR